MAILDIFSKRQKKLRGEGRDVYVYTDIPPPLRVQIVHIWNDALGTSESYYDEYNEVKETYKLIVESLCREYGLFVLSKPRHRERDFQIELVSFLLNETDYEKVLDAIEISFKAVNILTREYQYLRRKNSGTVADNAIEELNTRFKEHGIGYEFSNNVLVRIDSTLIHSGAVKPVLTLLHDKAYRGAEEEFLNAHSHYRKGNYKEALNDCLKSFESVMKVICGKRKWKYPKDATSKTLIQVCMDNGLVPAFWQTQMTSLRSLLESSIPTGRNKLSGHGQGATQVEVPSYLAGYVLNMTASTILFLVDAEKAQP